MKSNKVKRTPAKSATPPGVDLRAGKKAARPNAGKNLGGAPGEPLPFRLAAARATASDDDPNADRLPAPPRPITAAALGRLLELTPRAVGMWKAAGCPTEDGRFYRVAHVVKWLRQRERENLEEMLMAGEARERWEQARAQKTQAEADLASLELAKQRGQVVTVEEAMEEAGKVFDELRARILAVPGKEAHRFVGLKRLADAAAQLSEVSHNLLTVLSGRDLEATE